MLLISPILCLFLLIFTFYFFILHFSITLLKTNELALLMPLSNNHFIAIKLWHLPPQSPIANCQFSFYENWNIVIISLFPLPPLFDSHQVAFERDDLMTYLWTNVSCTIPTQHHCLNPMICVLTVGIDLEWLLMPLIFNHFIHFFKFK